MFEEKFTQIYILIKIIVSTDTLKFIKIYANRLH